MCVKQENALGMGCKMGGRFGKQRTHVYLRLIPVDVRQQPRQHCKAVILQLKINKEYERATLKVLMEKEDTLYCQMLNFNRPENYKSQMEMLEVKNIIEMRILLTSSSVNLTQMHKSH